MDRLEDLSELYKIETCSSEGNVKSKLIHQENGLRTFLLLPEEGMEVIESLLHFAKEKNLGSSHLKGAGSLEELTLGYPDSDFQHFRKTYIQEPLEVLFFSGQVRFENKEPDVRIRVVLGNPDGAAYGGYLLRANPRATFEIVIRELPNYLQYRSHAGSLSLSQGVKRNDLQTKIF